MIKAFKIYVKVAIDVRELWLQYIYMFTYTNCLEEAWNRQDIFVNP